MDRAMSRAQVYTTFEDLVEGGYITCVRHAVGYILSYMVGPSIVKCCNFWVDQVISGNCTPLPFGCLLEFFLDNVLTKQGYSSATSGPCPRNQTSWTQPKPHRFCSDAVAIVQEMICFLNQKDRATQISYRHVCNIFKEKINGLGFHGAQFVMDDLVHLRLVVDPKYATFGILSEGTRSLKNLLTMYPDLPRDAVSQDRLLKNLSNGLKLTPSRVENLICEMVRPGDVFDVSYSNVRPRRVRATGINSHLVERIDPGTMEISKIELSFVDELINCGKYSELNQKGYTNTTDLLPDYAPYGGSPGRGDELLAARFYLHDKAVSFSSFLSQNGYTSRTAPLGIISAAIRKYHQRKGRRGKRKIVALSIQEKGQARITSTFSWNHYLSLRKGLSSYLSQNCGVPIVMSKWTMDKLPQVPPASIDQYENQFMSDYTSNSNRRIVKAGTKNEFVPTKWSALDIGNYIESLETNHSRDHNPDCEPLLLESDNEIDFEMDCFQAFLSSFPRGCRTPPPVQKHTKDYGIDSLSLGDDFTLLSRKVITDKDPSQSSVATFNHDSQVQSDLEWANVGPGPVSTSLQPTALPPFIITDQTHHNSSVVTFDHGNHVQSDLEWMDVGQKRVPPLCKALSSFMFSLLCAEFTLLNPECKGICVHLGKVSRTILSSAGLGAVNFACYHTTSATKTDRCYYAVLKVGPHTYDPLSNEAHSVFQLQVKSCGFMRCLDGIRRITYKGEKAARMGCAFAALLYVLRDNPDAEQARTTWILHVLKKCRWEETSKIVVIPLDFKLSSPLPTKIGLMVQGTNTYIAFSIPGLSQCLVVPFVNIAPHQKTDPK